MTAKFDPPADIPHDEEFEWVNEWGTGRKPAPPPAVAAQKSNAAITQPAPGVDDHPAPSGVSASPNSETMGTDDAIGEAEPMSVPTPRREVMPTSAVAVAESATVVARPSGPTETAPGQEQLAGLYMSFRGGVLQRKEGILRPGAQLEGALAEVLPPPPAGSEAVSTETMAASSSETRPAPALSDAFNRGAAPDEMSPAPHGVVQHVRLILAVWNIQAARAVILDHVTRLLRTQAAARRTLDHLKSLLHTQQTTRRALGHLRSVLSAQAPARHALAHLRTILRAPAPRIASPVKSGDVVAMPPLTRGDTHRGKKPASEALSAHLRSVLSARVILKPGDRDRAAAAAIQLGHDRIADLAKRPAEDSASSEMPHIQAPTIAPDQLERDIADIVAVRDALLAETPTSAALADIKRRLTRVWTRVFH